MEEITGALNQPIQIKPDAYSKMKYLTELADDEVGGILVCDVVEGGIVVEDVLIPEQEVSSGYWEDKGEEALAKMLFDFAKTKPKLIPKMKGWWHKHPITGWSGTDDKTAEDFAEQCSWFLSINSDVGRDIELKLNITKPFGLVFNNLSYEIDFSNDKVKKWCEKEYKAKVTKKVNNINKLQNMFGKTKSFEKVADNIEPRLTEFLPQEAYEIYTEAQPHLKTDEQQAELAERIYNRCKKKKTLLKKPIKWWKRTYWNRNAYGNRNGYGS